MPFPTVNNDMLKTGILEGQIPIVGAGNKLPDSIINAGSGANQLLKLDGSGNLPAVDASQLTNLSVSSGGWNLLSTQMISTPVAEVDITGVMNSTYKNYLLILSNLRQSVSSGLGLKLSDDNGATFKDGGYNWATQAHRSDGGNDTGQALGATSIELTGGAFINTNFTFSAAVVIYNPVNADKTLVNWDACIIANDTIINTGGAHQSQFLSFNALQILSFASTFSSGTLKLYGLS